MPFAGLRVLSLESRRAKEMEALIRREGGDPFVAPSVQERALDDHGEAIRFVERLEADEFDMVIVMTGAGLAFLRDQVVAHSSAARLGAALRRVTIVSRGPKPLPILSEVGARAQIVVPEPNTWKEIVEAVAARTERRIAVQEYGRPNRGDERGARTAGRLRHSHRALPMGTSCRCWTSSDGGTSFGRTPIRCDPVHILYPARPPHDDRRRAWAPIGSIQARCANIPRSRQWGR